MFKGSIIKKCISLVMVIAVLMGIAAPASAATAELLDDSKIGYVALGDAITGGYGLEQEETRYHQIVAEYLGYEDTYVRKFGNRWRAEELRYLLDNDYKGDGYTKKNFRYLSSSLLNAPKWGKYRVLSAFFQRGFINAIGIRPDEYKKI